MIKLGALGDFIQALGPMKAIRAHHKNAHITLMTTKPFAEFGQRCGYFDDIIIDQKPRHFDLAGWLSLRKSLIAGHYTRVYDFQNNDRTSTYFRLFPRRKRPEWVGAAKGASHENNSPQRTAGHAFYGHVQTLGLAGITDITIDTLDWNAEDITAFNLAPAYALLIAGCSPQHPYKRWPARHFATLAHTLLERGIQPVLLGTTTEKDVTEEIMALCPNARDLTGQTNLFQIASLARHATCAIGNDTGPMHLIAATGCYSICLFSGHSNPKRHAPQGEMSHHIQSEEIEDIPPAQVIAMLVSHLATA